MRQGLMQKQSEIRKVEEALDGLRSAASDQAEILVRTQEHRAELEEELANVNSLNEQLESKLSETEASKRSTEEKLSAAIHDLEGRSTRVSQLEREKGAKGLPCQGTHGRGRTSAGPDPDPRVQHCGYQAGKGGLGSKLDNMEADKRQIASVRLSLRSSNWMSA